MPSGSMHGCRILAVDSITSGNSLIASWRWWNLDRFGVLSWPIEIGLSLFAIATFKPSHDDILPISWYLIGGPLLQTHEFFQNSRPIPPHFVARSTSLLS